jgi:hypothetical protein
MTGQPGAQERLECAIEGDPRVLPELRKELARCMAGAWIGVASAGTKPVAIRVTFHGAAGDRCVFLLTRPALQVYYVLVLDEAGRVVIVFDKTEVPWSSIANRLLDLLKEWYNVGGAIKRVEVALVRWDSGRQAGEAAREA